MNILGRSTQYDVGSGLSYEVDKVGVLTEEGKEIGLGKVV
ncbi:hypothetical protein SacN8_09150 [Sulfolobus acidocaldarius N8]|uniref:Uncharacterized protein n=2 Tax=Sulfolobus acidocaldarius TaxID=2285 RepID=M1J079_9CREN|nr:hypothetical protein SacN8_09150 [Sulfolobus acidocaldarius N8]AGE74062.1 hypothetical protein SacRon12I_09175 [Sulfolobus acidocaldarius Ron12/I]